MEILRKIRIYSLRVVGIIAVVLISVSGLQSVHSQSYNISDAEEFAKIVDTENAVLTTNATIPGPLLEGPVWIPEKGGYLIFSAMDSENKLKKLLAPFEQANLSDFYAPPPNTIYNGNTLDNQGRLVSAQAGGAGLRVVTTSLEDQTVTTLASTSINGLKFYSPNDVVVKSDGTIWFTDPGFNGGIATGSEGFEASYGVYRFHPDDGDGTAVRVRPYQFSSRPNGLCFSPDESILWVADWAANLVEGFTIQSDNTIPPRGTTIKLNLPANPDGIRSDVDGRIWISGGSSIYVFSPTGGPPIGSIGVGFNTSNLCFGGPDYKTLYITGSGQVRSIPVLVAGAVSLKSGPSTVALEQGLVDGKLVVSWPEEETGFALQETDNVASSESWENSVRTPEVADGKNNVEVDPATEGDSRYFRLIQEVSGNTR